LLQLNPSGSEDQALDLHPMITVVSGLSAQGRDRLLRAVRALPGGADPGSPGLVESHGIFLDLSPDTLALLDLTSDVDVVVGPGDVAQVRASGLAAGVLQLAEEAPTPDRILESTPEGLYPQLDRARARQADAREALQIMRTATDVARAGLQEAAAARRRAEATLEAATAADAAEEFAADARVNDEDRARDRERLERARRDAEAELDRVNRGITELATLDTRPVEVLVEAIRSPEPVELVPSERAQALADEFEALQRQVEALEAGLEAQGRGPASAMARLEAARAEVAEAERVMKKPELSEGDIAELEAAHEAVLEAENKAGSGFGRKAAAKRLDEARRAEQEILDRVGFPTWSAYVMGSTLLGIDPIAEERLNQAKFDLEAAEVNWAQITADLQANPEHGRLLEQLEAAYLEAIDLLGGDPEDEDLPTALRELKVAARDVTIDELVDALAYQLEMVGLQLGPSPVLDTTVRVAEAFLAEAATVQDRIRELEAERARLEGAVAVSERSLANLDAAAAAPSTIDLRDEPAPVDTDALRRQLEVALAEEDEAAEFLQARQALLDTSIQIESVATGKLRKVAVGIAEAEAERRAADPLAGFEALAGVSTAATDAEFDDVDEVDARRQAVEFYLLARLAALRSVSFAGSVPLLVDDALGDLDAETVTHLMGRLDRMADSVQVIYLSDDEVVHRWAESVGFGRAAVVPAPPGF
jgi:hypothetical protein